VSVEIEHSNWKNRVIYSWAVTVALLAGLIVSCFLGRADYIVHALSALVALVCFLVMVAPSAEQAIKMLAQVKAIKNGASE
jgi:hypothetical protein